MSNKTKSKPYASYRVNGTPRTTSMNIRCTDKMKDKYSDKIKAVFQYLEDCTSQNVEPVISEFECIFKNESK